MSETTAQTETENTAAPAPPAVHAGGGPPVDILAAEPYLYERCTLTVTLQFWPADGDPAERPVLVSARSHRDAPLLAFISASELNPLPPVVEGLLAQLRAEFPARARAHAERVAQTAVPAAPPARKSKPTTMAAPQPPRPRAAAPAAPAAKSFAQTDMFAPSEGDTP